MASPVIDPVGTSGHGSGSAVTGASASSVSSLITIDFGGIKTFNANDVIVVLIAWANAGGTTRTISSVAVSGGAHGPYTAHLRTSFVSTPRAGGLALYYIPLANQEQGTAINITATMSGSCDKLMISAIAYSGCFDINNPFDSNSGLLNGGVGNGANYTSAIGSYSTSAFSTAQAHDTLLFLQGCSGTAGPSGASSVTGFTDEKGTANSGGADWGSSSIWDEAVSATQSAQTVAFGVSANGGGTGAPVFIAIDALTGDNNSPGETGTAALAFAGLAFNATLIQPGKANLAFGGLAMAGVTTDFHPAQAALAFSGLAMAGATQDTTGAGDLAFGGLTFRATTKPPFTAALHFAGLAIGGFSGKEQLTGGVAFAGIAMAGAGLVPPISGGGLAFNGIAFDAGGGGRVAELDVAALAAPSIVAQVTELDVAALGVPGDVLAIVTELDVAVVAVPQATTEAQIAELDVAALVYLGPCATSRCKLWKITRRDGQVFAFTSLDRDFDYLGVTYKTCKSLTATASSSSSDLKSAGDAELTGVLDDASITDADLYAGVFDDAFVEVWVVPYDGQTDDQAPFRETAGWLGKVTRGEHNFTAEVIGPGGKMAQAGIVDFVTPACRWDFGVLDANGIGCPVDAVARQIVNIAATGSVLRSLINFTHADPGGASVWNNGKIIWQTGRNAGAVCQVETVDFGAGALSLWDLAPYPPAAGDLFTLRPGCPKTPQACKNYLVFDSFGGFPDVPGPDALQSNADSLFT